MFNEIIKRIYDAVEFNHGANDRIFPQGAEREFGAFDAYLDILEMMGHSVESACYYASHFISDTNKKCIVVSGLTIDGVTLLNDEKWTDEFRQKYGEITKGA